MYVCLINKLFPLKMIIVELFCSLVYLFISCQVVNTIEIGKNLHLHLPIFSLLTYKFWFQLKTERNTFHFPLPSYIWNLLMVGTWELHACLWSCSKRPWRNLFISIKKYKKKWSSARVSVVCNDLIRILQQNDQWSLSYKNLSIK